MKNTFAVLDTETMKRPNAKEITTSETLSQNITFILCMDGELLLLDDCGHAAICEKERFLVIMGQSAEKLIEPQDLVIFRNVPIWMHSMHPKKRSRWKILPDKAIEDPILYGYGTKWVPFNNRRAD